MAIEPPSHTLFNDLEEEREFRADARAAMAALISRNHPGEHKDNGADIARFAFEYALAMRVARRVVT